jgi:hypothetical protein
MARKFLTPIDLTKLEIQNVALQNLGADPGTPATGQIYYNTGGTVKVYNGTSWLSLSTAGGTVTSVTGTSPVVSSGGTTPAISLATAYGDTLNPYGTKTNNYVLAGAVSGGSTAPTFRALDKADIPSTLNATTFGGNIALGSTNGSNGYSITGLNNPTNAYDAVNKSYVDTIATGLNAHDAVSYASTGTNLTATYNNGTSGVGATLTNSGTQAVFALDGYTFQASDVSNGTRVLIKDQTLTDQNGVYVITTLGSASTNWVLTRATDYNSVPNVAAGDFAFVTSGSANGKISYIQISKPVAISGVGTTANAITFSVFANGNISGIVSGAQGGTGVANTGKTITISGNVTIGSSTDTVQFTTAGNTNVTLPTTGTLLTSASAVTSVNGSTGAITGVAKKVSSTVSLSVNTQATITHNLGTQAVHVQIFDSSWNLVDMDIINFDANNVKVTSQTAGTFNYVIIG